MVLHQDMQCTETGLNKYLSRELVWTMPHNDFGPLTLWMYIIPCCIPLYIYCTELNSIFYCIV